MVALLGCAGWKGPEGGGTWRRQQVPEAGVRETKAAEAWLGGPEVAGEGPRVTRESHRWGDLQHAGKGAGNKQETARAGRELGSQETGVPGWWGAGWAGASRGLLCCPSICQARTPLHTPPCLPACQGCEGGRHRRQGLACTAATISCCYGTGGVGTPERLTW